ncbi:biliverdin-producing heme oxygenase [Paractinoplanes durhamensis]|uniref:Heme oxygenase n=1 Tax=Paractinoplanes durhamensis TaxID=113563 RepID=A0ABQ3Z4R3_9ACTN|nr:biliverdin-producing heme oxygenase [Actinoplanes durhamensis]GIE04830.1 heme oxygenase [Actinoplanes durhamensis]
MSGFATRLRKATMVEHREAETRSFISRLMAGSVPRAGFGALTAQYLIVYRELEAAAETMRGNAIAAPFADPALSRVPALEADLAYLGGPPEPTAAAQRYADHLRAFCHTSPEHFIAHHYVRYLGDLSGGLLVGRKVAATYGLHDGGVSFYDFDHITDPKAYKIAYRERLDALPLDEERLSVLVAEAQHAFALNGAVFTELGAAYPEAISPAA